MNRLLLILFLPVLLFGQVGTVPNNARMLSGVNPQTGTSYTFVAQDSSRLTTFSNAGAIAANLPPGSAAGFFAGTVFSVQNLGPGLVTITCSGCFISWNGAPSATFLLLAGQGADIYSAGLNYSALGNGTPNSVAATTLSATQGIQSLPPAVPMLGLAPDPNQVCGYPSSFTNQQIVECTTGDGNLLINNGDGNQVVVTTINPNVFPGAVPTYQAASMGAPAGYVAGAPATFVGLNSVQMVTAATPGTDLGAKVNYADAQLGANPGLIQIDTSAGTTWITPTTFSGPRKIVFTNGGFYSIPMGNIIMPFPTLIDCGGRQNAVLIFSGTTGTAILANWTDGLSGWGSGIRDCTIAGPGLLNGGAASAGTGIQVGDASHVNLGFTMTGSQVGGFATGITWANIGAWGARIEHSTFENNGTWTGVNQQTAANMLFNITSSSLLENVEFDHVTFHQYNGGGTGPVMANDVKIAGTGVFEWTCVACSFDDSQVVVSGANQTMVRFYAKHSEQNFAHTVPSMVISSGVVTDYDPDFRFDTATVPTNAVTLSGGAYSISNATWVSTSTVLNSINQSGGILSAVNLLLIAQNVGGIVGTGGATFNCDGTFGFCNLSSPAEFTTFGAGYFRTFENAGPTPTATQGFMYEDATSHLLKWSVNGGAFNASLSATSGWTGTSFAANGTGAGTTALTQGADNSANCPVNSVCDEAPAAVSTSYTNTRPAAAASGLIMGANAAGVITQSFSGDAAHALTQTSKTSSITTATLCAATAGTACGQAGQYRISFNFWGSGTACTAVTAGSVALNITYTDEDGNAHTTIGFPLWDQSKAALGTSFYFNTAKTTESAEGSLVISSNGTIIQYATVYTGCTTGTGTYNLRATVEQVQ